MGQRIDEGLLVMASSIEKYKADLEKLIKEGDRLDLAMRLECRPKEMRVEIEKAFPKKEDADKYIEKLPPFNRAYQAWYSEAQRLIKQLLPDRYNDFVALYEKPKNRKEIAYGNYVLADYMQSLRVKNYVGEEIVGRSAAIPQFEQQCNIVKSVRGHFESSLFDIKQLVQADLLDSELDAARELLKNKFGRAAGAIAGVVLERHLQQVCENHNIVLQKKDPTISTLNDALKNAAVIETPQWRFIQHLGDIRNLCDHNKQAEPTAEQISDLIGGVEKITKTLF
jgi:hypothetical protein